MKINKIKISHIFLIILCSFPIGIQTRGGGGGQDNCSDNKAPHIKAASWARTWTADEDWSLKADAVIIFSGHNDYKSIMQDSRAKMDRVMKNDGRKYFISYGGGNEAGIINELAFDDIKEHIDDIKTEGFHGICLDVEECGGDLDPAKLNKILNTIRSKGLLTMVTMSHSAPYACSNKVEIMDRLIKSCHLDYLSPQLYTSGTEPHVDMSTDKYPWSKFADMKSRIRMIPSIAYFSHYADAKDKLGEYKVKVDGYICWNENCKGSNNGGGNNNDGGETDHDANPEKKLYFCASSYSAKGPNCSLACWMDGDCPDGLGCFAELDCCQSHDDSGTGSGKSGQSCATGDSGGDEGGNDGNSDNSGGGEDDGGNDGNSDNSDNSGGGGDGDGDDGNSDNSGGGGDEGGDDGNSDNSGGGDPNMGDHGPYFCAPDWSTKNPNCSLGCIDNTNCPSGMYCWAGVNCCADHNTNIC